MHRCSDFHVNGALQIFYDDDDDDAEGTTIELPKAPRSSAEGSRIEAPTRGGLGVRRGVCQTQQ